MSAMCNGLAKLLIKSGLIMIDGYFITQVESLTLSTLAVTLTTMLIRTMHLIITSISPNSLRTCQKHPKSEQLRNQLTRLLYNFITIMQS